MFLIPIEPEIPTPKKSAFCNECFRTSIVRVPIIRFANDMALLAEDERMLKNKMMELNERREDYGMKINISKKKTIS